MKSKRDFRSALACLSARFSLGTLLGGCSSAFAAAARTTHSNGSSGAIFAGIFAYTSTAAVSLLAFSGFSVLRRSLRADRLSRRGPDADAKQSTGSADSRLPMLARRQPPQLAEIYLDSLIQDAIARVRFNAIAQRVNIYFHPAQRLREVRGDRALLKEVLRNLFENAIHAMATLPVDAERALIITVEANGSEYEVVVSDTGPGLPAAVGAALFEPFVSAGEGGLGRGLTLCREVITAHGGTLRAACHPRGGAQLRFTLARADLRSPGRSGPRGSGA